jgi:hypothetical protein
MSCLDRARELERAEKLFDQLSGNANDLGLVAEELTQRMANCSATSCRRSATSG